MDMIPSVMSDEAIIQRYVQRSGGRVLATKTTTLDKFGHFSDEGGINLLLTAHFEGEGSRRVFEESLKNNAYEINDSITKPIGAMVA